MTESEAKKELYSYLHSKKLENNKLIDGFSSILIAVEYGIRKVECKKVKNR